MDWQEQLISVYLVVCKEYQQRLCGSIARLSNYCPMFFPDEEVITIYLFGVMSGRYRVKDIYNYTDRHLREWFPNLPSYEGYDYLLNKISHLFESLADSLLSKIPMNASQEDLSQIFKSSGLRVAFGHNYAARA